MSAKEYDGGVVLLSGSSKLDYKKAPKMETAEDWRRHFLGVSIKEPSPVRYSDLQSKLLMDSSGFLY